MGMFDTIHLKGRVAEDVKKFIGTKDLHWQTKDMDLQLTDYEIGDDLIMTGKLLRHDDGLDLGGPDEEIDSYFLQVERKQYTDYVESRYETTVGTLVLKFVDSKLQWIAHLQMYLYPLREHTSPGEIIDKFIIYTGNEPGRFVIVDHASLDTPQELLTIKAEAIKYTQDGFF